MASKHLNKIFLSASIPSAERRKDFFETADIIAIRDSVRALATVVIPRAHLVWGGHPSITPLIRHVMERMSTNLKKHVTIYQSKFFEGKFPPDNFDFEHIVLTEAVPENQSESVRVMRQKMFAENDFKAALFIGGMEGILDEYDMFRTFHPTAIALPIASTGAGARMIYNKNPQDFDTRLEIDYAYMALFKDLLSDILS